MFKITVLNFSLHGWKVEDSDLWRMRPNLKIRSRIKLSLRKCIYKFAFLKYVSGRISLILGSNYLWPINTIDSIVLRSQQKQVYLGGRSQTTLTSFWLFWPPPPSPLHWHFLPYKLNVDKNLTFLYCLPLSNVVCERPLSLMTKTFLPLNFLYNKTNLTVLNMLEYIFVFITIYYYLFQRNKSRYESLFQIITRKYTKSWVCKICPKNTKHALVKHYQLSNDDFDH
jgi:hypothetical protein